ncbi:MAG: methyltransferase domain-containing protein, partial [Candidatus Omnitrophica bacterium]|nr:methyltransferase domain-containing protein [Candidatus Omnitrophota bacterium]
PNKFEKHGIEPHPKAATIAKTRNIKIISDSIEGLNLSQKYQCITLLDTVEHFVNPTDTLDRLIVGIEQGGVIVICSGATDTLQWRIMAPYYWYCCLPEHVSFLNRKYLEKYCAKNSLYLALYKKISSEESVFPMNLVQWLKALLYCSDFVFRNSKTWDLLRKIPRINKIRQWSSPPWLTMSKNHFIAVIQKK